VSFSSYDVIMRKILVVEDNRDIAELVALHLRDLNAQVDLAYEGDTGLSLALQHGYDLIVLDLMLPGVDGLELCRQLRNHHRYTPILMLTARSTELDRVLGLEIGADDYLSKPFSIRELVARAKAIFRRMQVLAEKSAAQPTESPRHIGELFIDSSRREVQLHSKKIELTAKEFDLLWHFVQHPGQVFTRSQLLDSVWGYGHDGYEHTVNSHINRLRAKIEAEPARPRFILTVWGVGYKFCEGGA